MTPKLTLRQHQVAELVGRRLSCLEIAAKLGCSVATVHAHVLTIAQLIRAADPNILYRPAMKQVAYWARALHVGQAA